MQQVLIAVKFYATGSFKKVIGDLFGVSVFNACTVIHKVSRAIAKRKGDFLSFPNNLSDTKWKFYDIATFPSVIRAIDCTHIRIIRPNKENTMAFINRKQFHSINVQAICDSAAFITSFGLLKRPFPCMYLGLRTGLKNTLVIIVATAVSHYFALMQKEQDFDEDMEDEDVPFDIIAAADASGNQIIILYSNIIKR